MTDEELSEYVEDQVLNRVPHSVFYRCWEQLSADLYEKLNRAVCSKIEQNNKMIGRERVSQLEMEINKGEK
jgi:hypothetical protein